MTDDAMQLLSSILDVGEIMLRAGAEVNRVEDTMRRMAMAYGFVKVDVFTITSSIVVTVKAPEGEIYTQTRRIIGYDTDMQKVERCNALSRTVCKETLPLSQLKKTIEEIQKQKGYPGYVMFLTYGCVAAVFTGFFGGSIRDMLVAFWGGLLIRIVLLTGKRLNVQNIVLTIVCSSIMAALTVFFVKIGFGQSLDKIIIGNIMLLIPGIALTTSLRDMISGDLISGLLGLCEAIIRAVAIAAGVALVLWQMGGLV